MVRLCARDDAGGQEEVERGGDEGDERGAHESRRDQREES